MKISDILNAMRADGIPKGNSGLWQVKKCRIDDAASAKTVFENNGTRVPPGTYTYLLRWTEETLGKAHGELVMNDFPCELRKHLDFVIKAHGRVMVTGLGLGCVIRGLLARGRVDRIDLIERDASVIKLCGASVADPRVTLHQADARDWLPPGMFDFAWHDLWSDPDKNEPHLQLTHMKLMSQLRKRVAYQGAWAMPRKFVRRLPEFRLGATS